VEPIVEDEELPGGYDKAMIDKAAIETGWSDEEPIDDKPASEDPCLQVSSTSASKRMRWSVREDILLLKQVVLDKLYSAPHCNLTTAWKAMTEKRNVSINASIQKTTNVATVESQFTKLYDVWRAGNVESLKASGTEEEYGEFEQLIDDVMAHAFVTCLTIRSTERHLGIRMIHQRPLESRQRFVIRTVSILRVNLTR